MTLDAASPVIVLVGHSGVGKSTLGAPLAQALGYTFFDVDDEIQDLPDHVTYDAKLRRTIIAQLARRPRTVIAAGCEDFSDEIMDSEIKHRVLSVCLKADAATRPGRTRIVYTSFYSLSSAEQDAVLEGADLIVSLGSLPIPEATRLLVDSVAAVLPRSH